MFDPWHYKVLADLIRRAKIQDEVDQQGGLDMLQRMLADLLTEDNSRFNRDLFEAACDPDRS